MKAIDLFCGLGGWTDGLLSEGWEVVGYDIEAHDYGDGKRYPAKLVIQDVLTIHGSWFRDADLIVASPPCQEFSYMAMPWSRAKAIAAEYRSGKRDVKKLTALFDACFRIQREAIAAAGHFIPMVVENVRGAQPWVGRARWNFGSYYLWGDVPALMPITVRPKLKTKGPVTAAQVADHNCHINEMRDAFTSQGMNWSDRSMKGQDFTRIAGQQAEGIKTNGHRKISEAHRSKSPAKGYGVVTEEGLKQGGDWFNAEQPSISRMFGSKSKSRKAASAAIAKIPFPLARWIARVMKPTNLTLK